MGARVIRVMLLEDRLDTRELYVDFLRDAGFEVYDTADDVEALQLAAVHKVDIAVIDLSLGFGIARELGRCARHRGLLPSRDD